VWPAAELIRDEGFALWLGPRYYPALAVVQRVRLRSGEVAGAVRRTRDFVARRHYSRVVWQIGPSATPKTVRKRLHELGMRNDSDPVLKALALSEAPVRETSDVVVRRVDSFDDFERYYEIQQEAFETEPDEVERGRLALRAACEAESKARHLTTYLAYIDGEPVATARATFSRAGVGLNGGSTLHAARGRGAYRALVVARWDDAVAHGTPYLTTVARPTSYPILKRMGFEDVCDIHSLVDEGF